MQAIPDLMANLAALDDGAVQQIRKTAEDPPRVSVIDVIAAVSGHSPTVCSHTAQRLSEAYPEVGLSWSNFKFSGRGQRGTPVTEARGCVELVMVLPGKAAARIRRAAADVMVRYLGGDPQLVEEVAAIRLAQDGLSSEHAARLFGETVESEGVKRQREEVQLTELAGQAKRMRVQAATDVARLALGALTDLGLPVSDRDRMLAKDMITSAAFVSEQPALQDARDRDVCLQQFCAERGRGGCHISLGKKAKALYLTEHPTYEFPKKDVFANGQLVQANRWTASMLPYLERALAMI